MKAVEFENRRNLQKITPLSKNINEKTQVPPKDPLEATECNSQNEKQKLESTAEEEKEIITLYVPKEDKRVQESGSSDEKHLAWERKRQEWLNVSVLNIIVNQNKNQTRDTPFKCPTVPFPADRRVARKPKEIMRSVVSPYDPFNNFYKLEEVIEVYLDIWYEDDSDS